VVNEEQAIELVVRMLGTDVIGAEKLRTQLSGLTASTDEFGNFILAAVNGVPADGLAGVVVDAEATDSDGEVVFGLLHVVEGWLRELQCFRGDGEAIQKSLSSSDFEIVGPSHSVSSAADRGAMNERRRHVGSARDNRILVDAATLESAFHLILNEIVERRGDVLSISKDYFWAVPPAEMYNVLKDPTELTIGQVSESLGRLHGVIDGNVPVDYHLVWLADVLRALGQNPGFEKANTAPDD